MPPDLDPDRQPFPLGAPTNRPERPALTPISGRPNWYTNKDGEPVYVEPPRPKPDE